MTKKREYLYHVTTYRRLEDIAEDGLRRGRARAIGAPSYDANAARGIFLTEAEGVFFWHARAEDHAEHGSDDLLEDGVVPIVLRVDVDDLPDEELEPDEPGSHDARADAWISQGPIEPDTIEAFDGQGWVPVSDWEQIDPSLGVEEIDEDDEGEPIWGFPNRSELFPPELWPA